MMRTLRDMNMSKFVAEDVPLFMSLIDDLFPGGLQQLPVPAPSVWREARRPGSAPARTQARPHMQRSCSQAAARRMAGQRHAPCAKLPVVHAQRRLAGLKADRASFPEVSKALEKVALEKGYQLHAPWLNKCIQLYETYLVRHGIMLVRGCPSGDWRAGREAGGGTDARPGRGGAAVGRSFGIVEMHDVVMVQ